MISIGYCRYTLFAWFLQSFDETAVSDLYFDSMLLPMQEECTDLYWHTDAQHNTAASENGLHLPSGMQISFDGYYNLFPYAVYRDYTVCRSPVLSVTLQGCGTVTLTALDAAGEITAQVQQEFHADDPAAIQLRPQAPLPEGTAVLFWGCTAASDCILQKAHLTFEEPVQRTIALAVGICTYRREAFVTQNAERITALFSSYTDVHHHLFIADNGGTLGGLLENTPHMTVCQNPNNGGSGGFARTMQEVLRCRDAYTHLLLMDDDITFRPEILERMIFFLSHCTEAHQHVTVGGAMCFLDEPWKQFEAGARFLEDGTLQGLQMGLDLRTRSVCIQNAASPQKADYQSWWCCCMSVPCIRKAGLPMPFFIKMDDVEYALRLGQKTVCLPGVCVAHESFEKKYNPALDYYITRNTLITCALHGRDKGAFRRVRRMFAAVMRNAVLQRYDSAALTLRAYRDFMKGAKFLRKTDPAAHHKKIMSHVPAQTPSDKRGVSTEQILVPRWMRMLTLNGLLLPSLRANVAVDMQHAVTADAYRAKSLIHINPHSGMHYTTKLRRLRVWCLFWRSVLTGFLLLCRYPLVKRSYRLKRVYLKGEQFWGKRNACTADTR